MYDCEQTRFIPINDAFVNAMTRCHQINVIAHCCKCGCRIQTIWNAGSLDGQFMALYSEISEIWGQRLPHIGYIVCTECYNNKIQMLKSAFLKK